jgi:hypothetical protein
MDSDFCVMALREAMEKCGQDSRTNRRAGLREGGFSAGNALSAQCGIGIAFLLGAATRLASPGFGVCNHCESGARSADMERHCLPIRWLAADPETRWDRLRLIIRMARMPAPGWPDGQR